MGRKPTLNESEVNQILVLRSQDCSISKIAKTINRSRNVVYHVLKDPETYGQKKSTGRPRAVSDRDRRAILRVASTFKGTAREIAKAAGVVTNIKNVHRILQKTKQHKSKKLKQQPRVTTNSRKKQRSKFARDRVQCEKNKSAIKIKSAKRI